MVAAKQYPHFLYKRLPDGDSVQDENGNWVPAASAWTFHSSCREEVNGRGITIQGADERALVFSSLVLLPRGADIIPAGTQVRVCEMKDPEQGIRIEKPVLKCDIAVLHGRIWL